MRSPKEKFWKHKGRAKERNIPFLLTFEEWWKIWEDSGYWHERGHRKGQYVMARFGDKGPYATWNVKIITNRENSKEGNIGKHHGLGVKKSVAHKEALSRAREGRKFGPHKNKRSEELCAKHSHTNFRVDYLGNMMTVYQAVNSAGNVVGVKTAYDRIVRSGWPTKEAVELPNGSRIKNYLPLLILW